MPARLPSRSVVIFGGAGFIGSNWAHYLLAHTDANVHVFDNLSRRKVEHNLRWLQKLPQSSGRLKVSIADVRDAREVARAIHAATEIYHFAAQVAVTTSLDDPRADFEINAGGTFNILEAARLSGNRPFLLFTSTNKVYGEIQRPTPVTHGPAGIRIMGGQATSETQPLDFCSPYGCSKGTADQYVHDYARVYGLPAVVFRMSCIAGQRQFGNEDQGWVAHFIYSALRSDTISIYGDGHQVRDVLAVDDLILAFVRAAARREITAGEVYNIGGGVDNAVSLLDLLALIESALKVRAKLRFRPARLGDQSIYVTDFTKFATDTGWHPEKGVPTIVEKICRWFRENRSILAPDSLAVPAHQLGPQVTGEIGEIAS